MPAQVTTPGALSRNLASLESRNGDLVRALSATVGRTDLEFAPTHQGVLTAQLAGRPLASRHRPLDEAARLVEPIDLLEHATIVVLGFGLGYHVQQLAERVGKTGVIVVFEPDLDLLRSVFERIDHSSWIRDSLVVWLTDPTDRGRLAEKLRGAESIIAQGVEIVEHPASRARLGEQAAQFTSMFSEFVTAARTTLTTTLVRSAETIHNLLLNLDHYAGGAGIAELQNSAAGRLAVVVSAGPSLHKNMHELAAPGVRERCVIIAVQTTLKPLLAAGITPHFVTALDYHQISRRFYEELGEFDLDDVTLIVDPKAHPVILESYPGPVRCCAAPFCDQLLGELRRDMGTLPAGATVAHLALYLARFLGCNPIALIGQDLGFTDGLYYAEGTAIDDVWAPELNPFNTVEMMQWQRIARHRLHLHKTTDQHGRSIYTDAQMLTYLQQFERDFARLEEEGVTIIDATEGGVAKQHSHVLSLKETIQRHAHAPVPAWPLPERTLDRQRVERAATRTTAVRREVAGLRETSRRTLRLLESMLKDQRDPERMRRHFAKMDRERREVDQRREAFELLGQLNQLGAFKRQRTDRRLLLQAMDDPLLVQRAELERDQENVRWIEETASIFIDQLVEAEDRLRRGRPKRTLVDASSDCGSVRVGAAQGRIAALVPVDPDRSGLLRKRSLAEPFGDVTVLQATLEQLGRGADLETIILLAPCHFDPEPLIRRERIPIPVEIEPCGQSPFPPEQRAIAAARAWSDTCWRGGLGGMSVYDEVLCPEPMHRVLSERGFTAALLCAPDWPLVDVAAVDALLDRQRADPQRRHLVFTQAPPGLSGCVISAELLGQFVSRSRLATIGSQLVYQPRSPQGDPIARADNVQIDHRVRNGLVRAAYDSPRCRRAIRELLGAGSQRPSSTAEWVERLQERSARTPDSLPALVLLEITTARHSRGRLGRDFAPLAPRADLAPALAERLFEQLAGAGDVAVSLEGAGDPLLHPELGRILDLAHQAGLPIHLRTELRADLRRDPDLLDALLSTEVISVDLHADTAATYRRMMGDDGFESVVKNLEHLCRQRRPLAGTNGTAALALPWVVPRLQRCDATYEDIDSFFDRWQHLLGTAVIEGRPPSDEEDMVHTLDTLAPARTPRRAMRHDLLRRLTVRSDGSIPVSELLRGQREIVGSVADAPLDELWPALWQRRRAALEREDQAEVLRGMWSP